MLDVEDGLGCGDDVPNLPRAQADVAQGFERGLEQAVAALADSAKPVVGTVVRLLQVGELAVLGRFERDGDRVGFAFVAEVGQSPDILADLGEGGQQARVSTQASGVVFPAGAYWGGP